MEIFAVSVHGSSLCGCVGGWGDANRFSCLTHNQVALGCFRVGLLLLGLALGL